MRKSAPACSPSCYRISAFFLVALLKGLQLPSCDMHQDSVMKRAPIKDLQRLGNVCTSCVRRRKKFPSHRCDPQLESCAIERSETKCYQPVVFKMRSSSVWLFKSDDDPAFKALLGECHSSDMRPGKLKHTWVSFKNIALFVLTRKKCMYPGKIEE